MTSTKKNIISRLQKDILQWEVYRPLPPLRQDGANSRIKRLQIIVFFATP